MGPLVLALALAADPVTLDQLLNRSAWYLDYFIDQFENVVAEEDDMQDANSPMPTFLPFAGGGGRGGGPVGAPPSTSDVARARHRDLRSDFLLVKSPETLDLIPFRDVIAVDGVPVRDREERLARLFLNPTKDAMAHARAVSEEGARYNIGNMRTTLGNPVFGISVLQLTYQPRFKFTLGKEDRSVGPGVWFVDYQELASPAMVQGEAGHDLFAHGRLWIEAQTGRVVRTELNVEQPLIRAKVTTSFRFDAKFDIAVPVEMREVYTFANGNTVKTIASYGRFRRFDVTSEEDIKLPTRTVADAVSGMTFVEVPAGRFTMGSTQDEKDRQPDETLHDVELTHAFLLSRYETTQQEWRAVMGTNPSHFSDCGPRCPVEDVTYFDIEQFIAKLNARATAAGAAGPVPLPAADRSGMGVCVPRGDDGCVRVGRHANAGAGERQRQIDAAGRIVSAEPVGARRHARQCVGVDVRLVRAVLGEPDGEHRSARAAVGREARDSRRLVVLRRRQRAMRAALHAPSAGQRVQPWLSPGGGSGAMNAYCS